jgi:hypothetical protein
MLLKNYQFMVAAFRCQNVPMKTKGILLVLLCLWVGCAHAAPTSRPPQLDALAAQFKAAPATNRLDVARKIVKFIPACRVTYANGWFMHLLSFDGDEAIDLNHPSYQLPRNDLIAALGPPDHVRTITMSDRWDYLSWHVGRDRRQDEYGLYIQCYNGRVVSGYIAKTNTVQSIVTHTTLINSVIVWTNYIE